MSATCSIASSYSRFQASALKNNGVSGQHIDHHIRKRQPLDDPPRGGKLRYRFSAFWHDQRVVACWCFSSFFGTFFCAVNLKILMSENLIESSVALPTMDVSPVVPRDDVACSENATCDASCVVAESDLHVDNSTSPVRSGGVVLADAVLTDDPPASADCPNAVNEESYASRAARTAGSASESPRGHRPASSVKNDMPKRPRSALFTPSRSASAHSVFDALSMADIDASDVQCLQRKMNGEVVITFRSSAVKEKFVSLNSITVEGGHYAIQDIDRPLTFLTVHDAPFELSDWAIIKRLAPFCEVVHFRRGRFDFMPGVYNGLRHYRVRVISPIPSFLRFGKYLLFLRHAGQRPTCRRCNEPGHFSNACDAKICFNCENLGHEAGSCPAPMLCNFCKEDGHLSRDCSYSWVTPIVRRAPTDESAPVDVEDHSDDQASVAPDSFRWADDSDLSDSADDDDDDDDTCDIAEGLPLAAALPAKVVSPADPPVSSPAPTPAEVTPINFMPPNSLPVSPSDVSAPMSSDTATESSPVSSADPAPGTPLLFESSESPPDAQPACSDDIHPPSAVESDHILDSQGLIRPQAAGEDSLATPDPSSATATVRPRSSRRAPAPLPEALTAAGLRKPTSPSLVSGRSRSTDPVPASPMESSVDLKRKAQTPTEAHPRDKEKKKKGRKYK